MRALTWVVLIGLSLGSIAANRIDLAFLFAGVKAAMLGLSFMELKDAAREHSLAYLAFVAIVAAVLMIIV